MFKQGDLVQHLQMVPLFKFAKKRELQHIARELEVLDYGADTAVINEGDHGDAFFIILEGGAKVVRNRRTIATLGVGNHFGELALLDPAPRNASVVTTEPTKLAMLNARQFKKVLEDVPAVAPRLLTALASRAREAGLKDASG